MISVGRTCAGISGSGAEAATCGEGVVLHAESASADSATATSGQPKLRFPIDDLPLLLPATSQDTTAADRLSLLLPAAGLTRRHRPDGIRENPGNFGVRVRPAQGRYEAAGSGRGSLPCPLREFAAAHRPYVKALFVALASRRRRRPGRRPEYHRFSVSHPEDKFNPEGFTRRAGAMRIEIEAGNLARPQYRIVLGDGERGAQADRRCERAAPAGAM